MASLINVNGNVFLSISGSKPIALGIKASGDAASFKASLQGAYGRVSSKLSATQKIEFGMLMNSVMKSSNPLSMVKSGISRVAGPSRKVSRIARSMAKLLGAAAGKLTKTAPAAKPAPKIKLKLMRIDSGVIRRALSGTAAAKSTIQELAKNPKNQDALDKFLSAGKGKTREQITDSLFQTFLKIQKFNDAFDSIPLQAPKGLTLLRKAADSKSISELSSQEKIAMLRYYLYSYVSYAPPGKENLFKEKLAELGGRAPLKADSQNQNKPLEAQLLIAAATYIYGRKKENDLAKLDLKSAIAPVASEEEKQPEKPKPLRIAAIGDSITGDKVGLKTGYVAILDGLLKKTAKDSVVDPYGEKGQQALDIAKRFSSNLSGKGYNIVIIQGGVNDAYNYPKDQSKSKSIVDGVARNLENMVKAARLLGIEPILLTIHSHTREGQTDIVKERINEINKRIRAIAGARVVELPMLDGTLHPGQKGDAVIAGLLMKELAERSKTKAAPTPIIEKDIEEYKAEAQSMGGILRGFISSGAPERLRQLESAMPGKNILSSIPDKYPRIKEVMLNLVCQSAFNMLKEKDYLTQFNAFLISHKGYEELFDIKGDSPRKVRAHAEEEGLLSIERKGRKNPLAGKASLVVKSLQEFLNYQYNYDLKYKRQVDTLYGDKAPLGPKRDLRTDGTPDRALIYELTVYSAWLAKQLPTQKVAPAKTPQPQKVQPLEL